MTNGLIAPHAGELIINMAGESEHPALHERASTIPQLEVGSRQLADLEMLAIGAYSPLCGFMTRADYLGCVNDMHLANGLPWSIPITLAASTEQAATFKEGTEIALVNAQGTLQAIMTIEEKFGYDKQLEASYCRASDAMASSKTCPHSSEQHMTLSGTKVRQMLQAGVVPPREFSRPEVAQVLIQAMRQPVVR